MTSKRTEPSSKFYLESWTVYPSWNFNTSSEICGLSKRLLTDTDTNKICIGACGHAFHYDELSKWFVTQRKNNEAIVCPTCRVPWKYVGVDEEFK